MRKVRWPLPETMGRPGFPCSCISGKMYLIRTNFREALISLFSRFVKNREIKDSLKLGCAKIKHAKFNTFL